MFLNCNSYFECPAEHKSFSPYFTGDVSFSQTCISVCQSALNTYRALIPIVYSYLFKTDLNVQGDTICTIYGFLAQWQVALHLFSSQFSSDILDPEELTHLYNFLLQEPHVRVVKHGFCQTKGTVQHFPSWIC